MTSAPTPHPEIFLVDTHTHTIRCNGGQGALGHPAVYYTLDGQNDVVCGYCDRLFTRTPQTGAKPYHDR